jgi:tetratricopeptide (TPR) repeat protein
MRGLALLLALVSWLAASVASAAPSPEAVKKAREAFADGTTAFNLGQWQKAIDAWEKGYELKPDPIFLYNIAQAHRLAESFEKAIFFYKNYLRNSPKAPNRQEVEERIAQLEQAIAVKRSAREAPPQEPRTPSGAPGTTTGTPPSTAGTTPPNGTPPVGTPPPGDTRVADATPPPDGGAVATTTSAETTIARPAPPRRSLRRLDLGVSGGLNVWAAGVTGGAQPSTNLAVTGGYAVWYNDRLEFRVGAKIGYTYLADIASTDHFLSFLADPALHFRLWREHLFAYVEVGIGALVVTGVKSGSALLVPMGAPKTFAGVEVRPALGIEYRINSRLGVFVSPALIYTPSPDKAFANSSIMRFDISLGAEVRI